jgi:hypothetical protein
MRMLEESILDAGAEPAPTVTTEGENTAAAG